MTLQGKKIGILTEGDYKPEILVLQAPLRRGRGLTCIPGPACGGRHRGEAAGFKGHEYSFLRRPFESFEDMDDKTLRSYSAIIVPSGMVSDRLRFTEDVNKISPATQFLKRAFAEKDILKGIICHGMWLVATTPELVRGRKVVVHNNLIGDARNMGAIYTDQDVVVDGDLVTGRTGAHCHMFARKIIDILKD